MDKKPKGTSSAQLIEVIETRSLILNPTQILYQYFDLDGHLLAEHNSIDNNENLLSESNSADNEIDMDRRLKGTYSARLIKVIKTTSFIGEVTCLNPPRILYQYFDVNGYLLAEHDPIDYSKNLLYDHTSVEKMV